jgi:thiamine-monophosphate kinase
MPLSEFALIEHYFTGKKIINSQVRLGVGDDCALLAIPDGYELAVTMDTMVEGVHFFSDVAPEDLAHKLLAVNLSDLASMGAQPVAVTLALTLPKVDESWLERFVASFDSFAQSHYVDLVGGDTTRGPLTLSLQAMGFVPAGKALRRSHAKPGDFIYVTNTIGDAGLGLKIAKGDYHTPWENEEILRQFNRPTPRISEGIKIRDYATSCIDLSDGLLADLTHIIEASHVGACIHWEKIPLSNAVHHYIKETGDWQMPISAGDDYELCFTVNPETTEKVDVDCCQIGFIEAEPGLKLTKAGLTQEIANYGFKHFY